MPKIPLLAIFLGCALGLGIACQRSAEQATPTVPAEEVGARVREILGDKDPVRRVRELSALLPNLDPSAAPAIVDALDATPLDGGDPEFVVFGMWWAQHDPRAALAWTTAEWRARQPNVIAAVVRVWAHQDPKTALGVARGLDLSVTRRQAIDAAITGWDESGQPGLIDVLQGFNSIEFQQAGETLARRRVVALGAEGALRWVDSLPDGELRQVLSVRIASSAAADKDGARLAGEWARPRVIPGDGRLSNFPRRIGTRWVQHDPAGAMAWLASLPAGNDRDDGVAETFRTWAKRDWADAKAWAEKTALETWNEAAMAVYARAVAYERPKETIEMVRRFSNKAWREPTTIVVGRVWMGVDPEAAKAWLTQADLPEHTRENALIGRPGRRAGEHGGAALAAEARAE